MPTRTYGPQEMNALSELSGMCSGSTCLVTRMKRTHCLVSGDSEWEL